MNAKRLLWGVLMVVVLLAAVACGKNTTENEPTATPKKEETPTVRPETPSPEPTATDTPAPMDELMMDFVGREYLATVQYFHSVYSSFPLDLTFEPEYSDSVEEGIIISQFPEAGTVLKEGDTVRFVYSLGPNKSQFPSGKTLTTENLPVVDGALALEPFYDAVFAELLGLSVEDAKLFLPCNNTPGAYKNLTEGKADMIFCALPSDDQVAAAKEAGVEFDYHTILSGGFVFFVSRENPVDSITQEQLKGIVSGKIKNWKEVGGDDEPIVLFQRNEGSGSQTGLYRYVLPKDQVMEPLLEQRVDDMAGAIDKVADFDNGKGAMSFSYYYYVANMHGSEKIKLLGIDGVIPSDETISKGQYPFLNFSQIVTRKDLPADSIVRDIIAWVQGENGARIARENGYVPYDIQD